MDPINTNTTPLVNLDGDVTEPSPYDASKAAGWTWLGRRGGTWARAVGGYFFESGCPRCGCADCEPDDDGALTCEVADLDAETDAEAEAYGEEVCP